MEGSSDSTFEAGRFCRLLDSVILSWIGLVGVFKTSLEEDILEDCSGAFV